MRPRCFHLLIVFAVLGSFALPHAYAQSTAAQIAAVSGDAYSDDWSGPVRLLLLDAFDTNNSGVIDTENEVDAIGCDVWTTMNEAVDSDLIAIYGFDTSYFWVGDALGFHERIRKPAHESAIHCIEGWLPPSRVAQIVTQIAELDDPSTIPWKGNVGEVLVDNYDENRSGSLDTNEEVYTVDCAIWQEIEAGYEQGRYTRFWIGYGIKTAEYLTWNAASLGLGESVREAAWTAIQECIDVDSVPARGEESVETVQDAATQIRNLPDGGSFEWKSKIGDILVSAYDQNRSGSVDNAREVAMIDCEVWQAIDVGYRQGEYEQFWVGYGITTATHLTWNAQALRMTEATREDAWSAVQRCIPEARR